MGTDINIHVEEKTDAGWQYIPVGEDGLKHETGCDVSGSYVTAASVYCRRYMPLFKLLGACPYETDGIVPIARSRGIPDDISKEVRALYGADGDGVFFGASYLSVPEIKTAVLTATLNIPVGTVLEPFNTLSGIVDSIRVLKGVQHMPNVRIVFWFDC